VAWIFRMLNDELLHLLSDKFVLVFCAFLVEQNWDCSAACGV
jgi:hypothetical protein